MFSCTYNPSMPDPNVAGVGVIIGFMLNGVVTLLASYAALYMHRAKRLEYRPSHLRRITPTAIIGSEVYGFWVQILSAFVAALSDQLLVTSLVLITCAYGEYWTGSVNRGTNSLWIAADGKSKLLVA